MVGTCPTVNFSSWKTRDEEFLGFTSFVQELVAWASRGFVRLGREIEQSAHWRSSIAWTMLSVDPQSKAVRLIVRS